MAISTLQGTLSGVRILDLSRVLAGPFCAQILGDLGAEVIKVESPDEGDETRSWGPPFEEGMSAYFLACNRNKKGMTLNLLSDEGRAILYRLAAQSDVLIENMRPDSKEKLGLLANALHAANPKLIIVSISGFGGSDPWQRPGYDYVIQGMSGMMAMNGPAQGEPHKFGVAIADIVTGLYASTAILAALHARKKTSDGYVVDVSLLDCAVAAQANVVQSFLSTNVVPKRQGHGHAQIVPYQMFEAQDGYLILAVGNDRQWRKFCSAAGQPSLGIDPRFAMNADRVRQREVLVPIVSAMIRSRTLETWLNVLAPMKITHGPVWTFDRLFESDDAKRLGLKITARTASGKMVHLVRSPLLPGQSESSMPPSLGEHTDQILKTVLGLTEEEIINLRTGGAVG